MNYLELYKKWMAAGKLPWQGLCNSLAKEHQKQFGVYESNNDLRFFKPEDHELVGNNKTYWASGSHSERLYQFTPLRQTILLLMAAEKGHL